MFKSLVVEKFQVTHSIDEFKVNEVVFLKTQPSTPLLILQINKQTGVVACQYVMSALLIYVKANELIKLHYKALVKLNNHNICYN